MKPQDKPTPLAELQRRLVYALLGPAIKLSRLFRLPLGTVEELCRMAYFEEVRIRGGASQAQTAQWMGKSLRTVGNLEKQYRTDFLAPEVELTQAREVEAALDDSPRTLDQIHERVPHLDRNQLERLVDGLVAVGRTDLHIDGDKRLYTLNPSFVSLVGDDVEAQLDGLRHQLDVVKAAVEARFLHRDKPAVARTLSFVADSAHMEAMSDACVMALRQQCIEAEEQALKRRIREPYAVTFILTPMPSPDEHKGKG